MNLKNINGNILLIKKINYTIFYSNKYRYRYLQSKYIASENERNLQIKSKYFLLKLFPSTFNENCFLKKITNK